MGLQTEKIARQTLFAGPKTCLLVDDSAKDPNLKMQFGHVT